MRLSQHLRGALAVYRQFLGFGFAQGKTMLWRREIMEAGGGVEAGDRNRRRRGGDQARQCAGTERPPRRPAFSAAARPAAPERRLVSPGSLGAAQARDVSALLPARDFDDEPVHACRRGGGRAAIRGERRRRRRGDGGLLVRAEAILALAAGSPLTWRMPLAWIARDFLLPLVFAKAWTRHASSGAATR